MINNQPPRPYHSCKRTHAATATRGIILAAARRLFFRQGYSRTTMQDIASSAGIALDTIYASVGPKPAVFRLVVETAISGANSTVLAEQRAYVVAIRAEPTASGKLAIYAKALIGIHQRLAPVFRVIEVAALAEPDLKGLWEEIAEKRASNMKLFARNLAETGEVRKNFSLDTVADIVWSMSSPEFYILLVEERHWSPQDYASWLADAWNRLLLYKKGLPEH